MVFVEYIKIQWACDCTGTYLILLPLNLDIYRQSVLLQKPAWFALKEVLR